MDYHECEFKEVAKETYRYYYGSENNHSAWVTIKRNETGQWYYIRLNNVSVSGEFLTLQECIDIAYMDMLRSKI